ncbi:hypothetical protein NX059_000714 [Plenodomus lindquistii]|nr:hypothetical protein NX059_000714 [Plenodomus lindquistii]
MPAPAPAPAPAAKKQPAKTAAGKAEEQNKARMKTIVENMKRPEPVMIKMGLNKECPMPSEMLVRMRDGEKMTATDWKRVIDLLLPKHAPHAIVSIGANCTLPPLKAGEFGVWLRQMPLRGVRRVTIWCITTYGLSGNAVNVYCVRAVSGLQENLDPVAGAVGVADYMLHPTYNQETGYFSEKHIPYEDAILLDMLLDITAGDYTPHQRKIADGAGIQLEILQALEALQKENESASAATPSKSCVDR